MFLRVVIFFIPLGQLFCSLELPSYLYWLRGRVEVNPTTLGHRKDWITILTLELYTFNKNGLQERSTLQAKLEVSEESGSSSLAVL